MDEVVIELATTLVHAALVLFAMVLSARAMNLTDKAQQIQLNWTTIRDQALDLRTEADTIIDNARRLLASVRVNAKLSPEELRVLQSIEAMMLSRTERRR